MARTVTATTPCGQLAGRDSEGVSAFLGVPYAEPPVGERRFAAPVPRAPFAGLFDATRYGLSAPQHTVLPEAVQKYAGVLGHSGDDCLNLNVWSPGLSGRRPVLVFIHGGAFILGAGAQYPGDDLARRGDVVVVTLNHRLGLAGFNAFAELFPADARFAANAGFLDQRLALQWVRDNIAAFGGDPEHVTLAGESAGAVGVAWHLAAPRSHGLFQAAILQSGALNLLHTRERAVEIAERGLEALGAKHRRDALFQADADALQAAGSRLSAHFETIAPRPHLDTGELPGETLAELHGAMAPVPLLIGTNRDEFSLFSDLGVVTVPSGRAELDAWLARVASPARAEAIGRLYADDHAGRIQLGTDLMFRMAAIHLADTHGERAPTFMYRLDWSAKGLLARLGATHSVDLPLLFEDFLRPFRSVYLGLLPDRERDALSGRMRDRWLAFVRDHRPGADWPAYTTALRETRILDARDSVLPDPEAVRRRAWRGVESFGI